MPTGNENQELYMLEYALAAALKMQTNALFLARITCDGKQELSYRIRDPKAADSELKRLVLSHATRVWEYRTDNDPNWGLAKGELQLLLKDSKFTS